MTPALIVETIINTTLTAFGLAVDLFYKLGMIDEASVENSKALCAERIRNYDATKAALQAKHWRQAQGLE